ncbi:MAG: septum formation protein [Motiliproteus sp.]|jgi:septum formation protein
MVASVLILASASPRRRELLAQIGARFECRSADIDESVRAAEPPAAYVSRLALEKASAVAALAPDVWVLGSDTSVVCEQQILGKPAHKEEAVAMLLSLSGRRHQVLTAVALVRGEQQHSLLVITDVWFKTLSRTECEAYWDTGEPRDKAGSYAIQGFGAVFVERIEGSYSAVVGLPLQETSQLLQQLAVPIWQQ